MGQSASASANTAIISKNSIRYRLIVFFQSLVVVAQMALILAGVMVRDNIGDVFTIFFTLFLGVNIFVLRTVLRQRDTFMNPFLLALLFQGMLGYGAIAVIAVGSAWGSSSENPINNLFAIDLLATIIVQIVMIVLYHAPKVKKLHI